MVSFNFKTDETINQMSIQVKFFASLREKIGRSDITLTVTGTALEIWRHATNNAPMPDNLLVSINLEYAKLDSLVNDGDEVAFFPPVTGG